MSPNAGTTGGMLNIVPTYRLVAWSATVGVSASILFLMVQDTALRDSLPATFALAGGGFFAGMKLARQAHREVMTWLDRMPSDPEKWEKAQSFFEEFAPDYWRLTRRLLTCFVISYILLVHLTIPGLVATGLVWGVGQVAGLDQPIVGTAGSIAAFLVVEGLAVFISYGAMSAIAMKAASVAAARSASKRVNASIQWHGVQPNQPSGRASEMSCVADSTDVIADRKELRAGLNLMADREIRPRMWRRLTPRMST